ncbi:MAG: hypothetical protein NZ849_10610 [Meiothermus sp.]|uniref:hypothetical protein n=1 Tax=Meiothermus sp. TaxID=1955249 RepID=UPI0025F9A01A|nr:hypothetical protein [Meiothermus sp.]MCS7059383.1 hypothetical protein [Meiothermus sp.]MCS7195341.1 hypothetical protein [Meiothermus sp.]MCX7739781.1 hypothetical protein [Meiothermus sp.]MDW8090257.1 hypothetical protein [Meiothermus sp.]MDW8481220.1 hypothetical protein [Meiothermus sp.]
MKKALVLAFLGGIALAQPGTSPFVDVPPCHWAREALQAIARPNPEARPTPSAFLAENALRQVFEGLRCGDPGWSQRFLLNPSPAFGQSPASLRSFTLEVQQLRLQGERATLRFTLAAVLEQGALRRNSEAALRFTPEGWKVEYASLVGLELPFFPR